jgi:hypothetical protein
MCTFEKVKIIFRRNKLLDERNSTTHKKKEENPWMREKINCHTLSVKELLSA